MDEKYELSADEQSYHSFNPVPASNFDSRPEELDEVSHTSSAYSNATQQTSNVHGGIERTDHEPHMQSINEQETYGEEEESISNIFKSLSEIQTRLASKGREDVGDEDAHERLSGRDQRLAEYSPPKTRTSWGQEGVVEDASVDGSQVSSFSARMDRSKRPAHGQWMEPVEEK